MTCNIPHPTEWPIIERQERLIDALLLSLDQEQDPEQVRSIVNIIAESLDVPLLALPDDPMEKADFLGDQWLTALWQAGADREPRRRCVRMAVGQLRELLAVISDWDDEREDELRS